MKLTDKAKKDFEKWYYKEIHYVGLIDIDETIDIYINSAIVMWLDSINIYISIKKTKDSFGSEIEFIKIKHFSSIYLCNKTRCEITEESIVMVNDIYNEKYN